jgi:NitT/TauT family transport system ATP-binding protein
MADPLLRIVDLHLSFGENRIFEHFNLQLDPGQIIRLTGSSGRGKTTILRMVTGLETRYRGEITTTFERPAFIFQDVRLLPWLSAAENVALPLMEELGKATALKKAESSLDACIWHPFIGVL